MILAKKHDGPFGLFFWFKGVDHRRAGGPWWYRSFETDPERQEFLRVVGDYLVAWAFETNRNVDPRCVYPNENSIVHPFMGGKIWREAKKTLGMNP